MVKELISGKLDSKSRHESRRVHCAYLARQRQLAYLAQSWYFHCFSIHYISFDLKLQFEVIGD